ncbi:diacylglycerol O-acyltransferase 1-like [Ornithodoros turicata]|uniref:diacylglycerol O-acyltransferase 1-like n=1 Tax=Ornithodoros turicata TaxID=34597 RepID=UPI003139180A
MVECVSNGSAPCVVMRRTLSMANVQHAQEIEKKERRLAPDCPIHRPQDSLLSGSRGWTNYRGLFNFCIILLILSNGRVALENLIKYGILVDPVKWIRVLLLDPGSWPPVYITFGLNFCILFSLWIEKLIAAGRISDGIARNLQVINFFLILLVPPMVVLKWNCNPVTSSMALACATVLFLKLVSYHMVNLWCRQQTAALKRLKRRSSSESLFKPSNGHYQPTNGHKKPVYVTYPDNLNLNDIYYFVFVPTLCYELNFPRSARIRKRFLFRRFLESLLLLQLILALAQQWIVPIMKNSLKPFQEMNFPAMLERLLKLAVPNILIWLVMFYWFFHSTLNTLAELMRFADREFYRDWWNAETVQYFWQNWNIPVHRWCLRHLYKPLIAMGMSKQLACIHVFLLSAFFHEYLVSVPLKMFRVWAFSGMLAQVPFAFFIDSCLQNRYRNLGNMAVWMSLMIGQPLAILMYYHDYYIINYGSNEST